MAPEKLSALLSLLAAVVIALASFWQWWGITWDGGMPLKPWAKVMLAAVVLLLLSAICVLLRS